MVELRRVDLLGFGGKDTFGLGVLVEEAVVVEVLARAGLGLSFGLVAFVVAAVGEDFIHLTRSGLR